MTFLGCIWAIALNTMRESIRNRVLYALLFFAVLVIGAGTVVSTLSYVENERIIQDIGLGAIRLFGVAIAIFVGINLIHKEVDRRTVYTILSKPISRGSFLIGKFVGLTLTIWLQTLIMGVVFAAVSLGTGAPLTWVHTACVFLIGVELALVVAIATLFSAFTTPFLAAFFTSGVWIVGQLTRDLRDIAADSELASLTHATALAHRVLPDLETFNLAIEAAHALPVAASEVALASAYGAAYIAVVLAGAVAIFERRDFR